MVAGRSDAFDGGRDARGGAMSRLLLIVPVVLWSVGMPFKLIVSAGSMPTVVA